jgi:hypothetical protein
MSKDIDTNITILLSEGTVDELVDRRLGVKLRFMGSVLNDEAVLELADLEEEPNASAGMDSTDVRALLDHLSGHVSA